ncbi:hypothetical protein [Robertmurraya kyonggiensis]|uniref:Uncharacterized protein n=1 Tax=Robertmurraya kyonggiensis TaxID=1037680 RepID=A0A4U1D2W4_9BACI|nr:hypothetical protein [Robertmurraya kyonggiensis]TKC16729.1 hypothetical protein FA727_11695 [Robertmurraya kyonggiensis]
MTFCFEMMILSYLKAYTYYPMLVPNSPPDDSIAGNLFSQFSVSATALLIVSLNMKYYWYFIFALVYSIIEELFIVLGVYKQHWYQTWMTFVFLLILFWVTKHAYRICFSGLKGSIRYIFIFLGLVTLHENSIIWVLRLIGIQKFSENLQDDKQHSLILLASLYMLLLGIICMLLYFSRVQWGWKLAVILLLYIMHWLAMMFDLIIYKAGWFWISTSISIWGMYFFTYLIDKIYESRVETISDFGQE